MDTSAETSASLVKTAVARVFQQCGSHLTVKEAVLIALASRCRDRDDVIRNLFSERDVNLYLSTSLDAIQPSVAEFGALVRQAVSHSSATAVAQARRPELAPRLEEIQRALRCTLSETRQREHWARPGVALAAFAALHFDDCDAFVDSAVWGAVRADVRRLEELHQQLARKQTALSLLSGSLEALACGF